MVGGSTGENFSRWGRWFNFWLVVASSKNSIFNWVAELSLDQTFLSTAKRLVYALIYFVSNSTKLFLIRQNNLRPKYITWLIIYDKSYSVFKEIRWFLGIMINYIWFFKKIRQFLSIMINDVWFFLKIVE